MSNVGSSTSYRKDPKETTEWEDILHAKGIVELPPERLPEVETEEPVEPEVHKLEGKTAEELEELDDDDEWLDSHELEEWRRKRMAELAAKAAGNKFGAVLPLVRADFVREVSDASKDGTWVVVFLHEDGVMDSRVLDSVLPEVAARCPSTKFMRIRASQCIEGYPDRNVPTLLVYHNGELDCQVVGLAKMGGRDTNPDVLEWILSKFGAVETELAEDPRPEKAAKGFMKRF